VIVGEPPNQLAAWLESRRARGLDLFDEVWEGVAPAPRPRHGRIDRQLAVLLEPWARAAGLVSFGAINVGEPDNYRVPGGAFLREHPTSTFVPTAAIVVEIVSPGDETYDKFAFYFSRGVEEILVVDSTPGAVQCYARGTDGFERTGRSRLLSVTEEGLAAEIDWPPPD
jgi:Uma2 family endonuclease